MAVWRVPRTVLPMIAAAAPAQTKTVPARFARAYRGTGYCRLSAGPLARGTHDGREVSLMVPVEQVVAVDVRTRSTGAPLSVSVTAPEHLVEAAYTGAMALGQDRSLTGDMRVTVRPPVGAVGYGMVEATAAATIAAIAKAEELSVSPAQRAALVAKAGAGNTGVAHGVPALVTSAGAAVGPPPEDPARLMLVIAAPRTSDRTSSAGQLVGELPAPPADVQSVDALAQWLVACAGDGTSPARQVLAELARSSVPSLGVLGGYGPADPVVVLLEVDADMRGAQHLMVAARAALADVVEGWTVSVAKTAAPSAAY